MRDLSHIYIQKMKSSRPLRGADVVVAFDRVFVWYKGRIYVPRHAMLPNDPVPYAMWNNKQVLHRALRLFGIITPKEEQELHDHMRAKEAEQERKEDYRDLLALCQRLKLKVSKGAVQ